jgi:hypothetical protein
VKRAAFSVAAAALLVGCSSSDNRADEFDVDVIGKTGGCYTVRQRSEGFAGWVTVTQQPADKCRTPEAPK